MCIRDSYQEVHGRDLAARYAALDYPGSDVEGKPAYADGRFTHVKAVGWVVEKYRKAQISINLTDYKVCLLYTSTGAPVFHTLIVHLENELPLQCEDRYVNPVAAPGYLSVDFTRTTPTHYLLEVAPLWQAQYSICLLYTSRCV